MASVPSDCAMKGPFSKPAPNMPLQPGPPFVQNTIGAVAGSALAASAMKWYVWCVLCCIGDV